MVKNELSPELKEMRKRLLPFARAAVELASIQAVNVAKSNHRYRDITGTVTAGTMIIPAKTKGAMVHGGIQNTTKVGLFLHEGTGLYGPSKKKYLIKPKNGKTLAFEITKRVGGFGFGGAISKSMPGMMVFTKAVEHPGIRPDPFLLKAIRQIKPTFYRLCGQAVKRAAKG